MVVVAVLGRVILSAHVDNGVAGGEESRVTGADEGGWVVGGEHAEQVNGESLIGVEVTIVGTDQGTGIHSHSLGFCHSEEAAQHQY